MSLLEQVVAKKIALGCEDRRAALEDVAMTVQNDGGFFHIAQTFRVLVNDSGEDFAIEFMTAYNNEIGYRY